MSIGWSNPKLNNFCFDKFCRSTNRILFLKYKQFATDIVPEHFIF